MKVKTFVIAMLLILFSQDSLADCDDVRMGEFKIEAREKANETVLSVTGLAKMKAQFSETLPDGGEGQECLGMQVFEKQRLLLVHYNTGFAGTSELVFFKMLLAYKISDTGSLTLVEKIYLSEVHSNAKTQAVIFQKEPKVISLENRLRVTLKNLASGALEHVELQ